MANTFEACYQVEDGYVGKYRPKTFKIHAGHLEEDMSDEEIENFYLDEVMSHFNQNIYPSAERKEEFIQWAREQISNRSEED